MNWNYTSKCLGTICFFKPIWFSPNTCLSFSNTFERKVWQDFNIRNVWWYILYMIIYCTQFHKCFESALVSYLHFRRFHWKKEPRNGRILLQEQYITKHLCIKFTFLLLNDTEIGKIFGTVCTAVYDRSQCFGLGPIPKPKPILWLKPFFKQNIYLPIVCGILSIIKGPLKPNLLQNIADFLDYFWRYVFHFKLLEDNIPQKSWKTSLFSIFFKFS